jgi:hypothetical protein
VVLDRGDASFCGATGAVELLEAIREVSAKCTESVLIWNGAPLMTLVPARGRQKPAQPQETAAQTPIPQKPVSQKNEPPIETAEAHAHGSHAYVQGTPITNYTPVLVETPALDPRRPAAARSYLFLTDQPDAWREFEREIPLRELTYTVVTPSSVPIPGAHRLDVSSEESLREGLERLGAVRFDTIVAIRELSRVNDEDLLLTDFAKTRGLLDLLFGFCRHR